MGLVLTMFLLTAIVTICEKQVPYGSSDSRRERAHVRGEIMRVPGAREDAEFSRDKCAFACHEHGITACVEQQTRTRVPASSVQDANDPCNELLFS